MRYWRMILICGGACSNRLTRIVSNALGKVHFVDNISDVYSFIEPKSANLILFDSLTVSKHLNDPKFVKYVHQLKKKCFARNLYVPIFVAIEGNNFFDTQAYRDLGIDGFIRLSFGETAFSQLVRRYQHITKFYKDMCERLIRNSDYFHLEEFKLRPDVNLGDISVVTFDVDKDVFEKLKTINFANLKKSNTTQVQTKRLVDKFDCIILGFQNFKKNPSQYHDLIMSRKFGTPVLFVNDDVLAEYDETLNYINDMDIVLSCSDGFEIQKKIESLVLYKKLYNELNNYFFNNFELSIKDSLTGLYNRRFIDNFFLKLDPNVYAKKPISICIIDLDNFKKVNDSFGHLSGDAVLTNIGKIMNSLVKKTDYVCRYGGDEFLIIMPNTSNEEAKNTVTEITNQVNLYSYSSDNGTITITFSSSVYTYYDDISLEKVIHDADKKLRLEKDFKKSQM